MAEMNEHAATFTRRLQELREDAGISQYELAKRSGLSKQALSRLEQGGRDPSWSTACILARTLGVSVAEFDRPAERPAGGRKKGG